MELQHSSGNKFQTKLSRKEMFEISNEISKNYSPAVSEKLPEQKNTLNLSGQDLLEISQNISLYFAPRISTNINKLVVLPIDPQHLYAYWELDDNKAHTISQSMFNNELTLRVYSRLEGNRDVRQSSPLAEIAIHEFHSRQRIKLPAPEKATAYSATIGKAIPENGFVPLLDSNNTHTFYGTPEYFEGIKSEACSADFDNAVDNNFQAKLIDDGASKNAKSSVKEHYASTNYSAKGKKR